jgi:hypothetical protein
MARNAEQRWFLTTVIWLAAIGGGWARVADDPPCEIYCFELSPTAMAPGASGEGRLRLAWSPFGIAVSESGFLVYELELTIGNLPPPGRLGSYTTYVAWIASPELDRVERLGAVAPSGALRARIQSWNKFLVLVTPERHTEPERRAGPVVLQGRSPSGLMASFQSHELFNNMPH